MQEKLLRKNLWIIQLLALLVPILVFSYAEGPPSGVTGGFNEPNCTDCHRGTAVNAGGGSVAISAPSSYSSGGSYSITVTVFDSVQRRWGFELSARTQDGHQAGTLMTGPDGFTQLLSSINSVQYISHSLNGTRNGTRDTGSGVSFTFSWQAPDVSAGPVVFNAAGNAANGDLTNSGDHIYTTSTTVPPQAVSSGPPPSINDLGIVNNASFAAGSTPLAAGTIAAIFGTNLNDGSTELFSSFGSDGKLLTTLGGAQVMINGVPAPLFYSTPTQLGVQIPTELTGSSVTVQVTVAGQTSNTQTISIDTAAPGIFSLSQNGSGQGAVLIANSDTFAAPSGSVSGGNARPAAPGEFVTIFCTGLGQVIPALPTGVGAATNTTVATPTVTIDGMAANVEFSGMAPGFVGLNQVNVQVPAGTRSSSSIPVVLTINGKQSNTVTIAVSGP
jgi:uncharacterized protein (TIGR03437 family)